MNSWQAYELKLQKTLSSFTNKTKQKTENKNTKNINDKNIK
jgi:hypothetical protein